VPRRARHDRAPLSHARPRRPRADTWWPAHAALERFHLDGRLSILRTLYPFLEHEYWRWVDRSITPPTATARTPRDGECLWQACHDDGEENSIGLDGCRPSINAAMHGEATALEAIATLLGEASAADTFGREAQRWRRALHSLWSHELQFFVTRTRKPPPARADDIRKRRTKLGCLYCPPRRRGASCPPEWADDALVDVRELAGLSWPFYHRAASPEHAVAWRQVVDPLGLRATWGLRTAERRHTCYNFSTWCPTSWNGPVWPFESAKAATALIHALRDEAMRHAMASSAAVDASTFYALLAEYARMHTRGSARDVARGQPFVGECFHPDEGYWLTRELLYQRRQGDKRRGDHYLHSSYADLVLGGLVGVHVIDARLPTATGDAKVGAVRRGPDERGPPLATLVVEPLFVPGEQLRWFSASGVRVRGRDVAVAFDADGSRYRGPPGLRVWLDGRLVANAPTLRRLTVPLGG
jgi:hypothetical protein